MCKRERKKRRREESENESREQGRGEWIRGENRGDEGISLEIRARRANPEAESSPERQTFISNKDILNQIHKLIEEISLHLRITVVLTAGVCEHCLISTTPFKKKPI